MLVVKAIEIPLQNMLLFLFLLPTNTNNTLAHIIWVILFFLQGCG